MNYTVCRILATARKGGRQKTGKRKNSILCMTLQRFQRPRRFLLFSADTHELFSKSQHRKKCINAIEILSIIKQLKKKKKRQKVKLQIMTSASDISVSQWAQHKLRQACVSDTFSSI